MPHTDPIVQATRKRARKIVQAAIRRGARNEDIASKYGVTAQCVANWRADGSLPTRRIAEKIVKMEDES